MLVEIYTKADCPHCVRAKQLLKNNNIPFTEWELGRNITKEVLLERFPDAKFVPIILIDDQKLDSVNSLQLLLEQDRNIIDTVLLHD